MSFKGKHHTEVTKKLLSEIRMGRNNPFYGKHHIEEELKKMRIANTGRHHTKEAKDKISKANKGKRFSEEHKKNISKTRKQLGLAKGKNNPMYGKYCGKDNHFWQGGISFEPYAPEFNRQLKELIRQRDGYKCQLCGIPEIENIEKLTIHHIDYVKKNCLPENLIALCRSCNSKVNANRNYWTGYFKEKILTKVILEKVI